MQNPQRRDDVGDFRDGEQAAEAHHLDRDAPRLDGCAQHGKLGALAAEHRDVGRSDTSLTVVGPRLAVRGGAGGKGDEAADPFGYPVRLGGHRLRERTGHLAAIGPARWRHQPRHIRGLSTQSLLQCARRVEHPAGVAEAGRQQPDLHRGRSSRAASGPARGDGEVP